VRCLAFLYVPIAIICSTRSTRRTCRAGHPRLTTKWFPRDPHGDMQTALWLSLKAAALATLIRLVLGTAASFGVHRSASSGARRSRSCSCSRSRCPGSSRHGAELVLRFWKINFGLWTIVIGTCDLLLVVRLQQRDRASPARAGLADRSLDDLGADGWQTFRYRHVPRSRRRSSRVAARLRALGRRGDCDHVHRRHAEHAAHRIFGQIRLGQQLPQVNVVCSLSSLSDHSRRPCSALTRERGSYAPE